MQHSGFSSIWPYYRGRSGDAPLRVWVPGCSTGEEVYSIAICLLESISKLGIPVPVQILGTDLSERAIRNPVRAAEAIFNHAAKAIEIEDIEARVAALEAAAGGEQRR
jgi:chemotaxis methyl-accepting protein methylase